jgi:hypothetical protein
MCALTAVVIPTQSNGMLRLLWDVLWWACSAAAWLLALCDALCRVW